ncbi:hypothetical protein AKJ16_DCAP21361 [Drosera capensis]
MLAAAVSKCRLSKSTATLLCCKSCRRLLQFFGFLAVALLSVILRTLSGASNLLDIVEGPFFGVQGALQHHLIFSVLFTGATDLQI